MAKPKFTVKELRGLYLSFDKDGKPLITAPTEELCRYWSERYLTPTWERSDGRVVNDGVVGGKL